MSSQQNMNCGRKNLSLVTANVTIFTEGIVDSIGQTDSFKIWPLLYTPVLLGRKSLVSFDNDSTTIFTKGIVDGIGQMDSFKMKFEHCNKYPFIIKNHRLNKIWALSYPPVLLGRKKLCLLWRLCNYWRNYWCNWTTGLV